MKGLSKDGDDSLYPTTNPLSVLNYPQDQQQLDELKLPSKKHHHSPDKIKNSMVQASTSYVGSTCDSSLTYSRCSSQIIETTNVPTSTKIVHGKIVTVIDPSTHGRSSNNHQQLAEISSLLIEIQKISTGVFKIYNNVLNMYGLLFLVFDPGGGKMFGCAFGYVIQTLKGRGVRIASCKKCLYMDDSPFSFSLSVVTVGIDFSRSFFRIILFSLFVIFSFLFCLLCEGESVRTDIC